MKLEDLEVDTQVVGIEPAGAVKIVDLTDVDPLPHQISAVYEAMLPKGEQLELLG